jgi:hypothetical protein
MERAENGSEPIRRSEPAGIALVSTEHLDDHTERVEDNTAAQAAVRSRWSTLWLTPRRSLNVAGKKALGPLISTCFALRKSAGLGTPLVAIGMWFAAGPASGMRIVLISLMPDENSSYRQQRSDRL